MRQTVWLFGSILLLTCCITSFADEGLPRITKSSAVAAVDPGQQSSMSLGPGWSQRVGNILVARVSTKTRGYGNREAWLGYDVRFDQLRWMTRNPKPFPWGIPPPCANRAIKYQREIPVWAKTPKTDVKESAAGLYLLNPETGRLTPLASDAVENVLTETNRVYVLHGAPSEPALDLSGDSILLASPSHVRSISAKTGKLEWETELPLPPGPATYRAYPSGNFVYLYSELGRIISVHLDNGQVMWSRDFRGIKAREDEPWSEEGPPDPPVLAKGNLRIYFPVGHTLYALDWESGRTLWKATIESRNITNRVLGQPVAWGLLVVLAVRDYFSVPPSEIWALDARTGETVWTYRLGQTAKSHAHMPSDGNVWNQVASNLLVFGDELLFCTSDGVLRALGNDPEGEHWQLRLVPHTSSRFTASLYAVGPHVIVFNGTHAWRIETPACKAPANSCN